MTQQLMKVFFDPSSDRKYPSLPAAPTEEQIRMALSNNNKNCPLNKVIVSDANEGNMRILRDFAFTALKRFNRSLRGCNFGIYAGSGQGKTYVVKQFAKTIGIPFVFVQAASIANTWDLFEQIKDAFAEHTFGGDSLYSPIKGDITFKPIVEWKNPEDNTDYTVPPCIVFFDEAHLIPRKMMKGGLLNAMERDDGIMALKAPGINAEQQQVNCRNICWVAATTERGMLFDALENRLGTAIEWHAAGVEEITQIVKMKMDEYHAVGDLTGTMPEDVCEMVAQYRRVPREALNFATKVIQRRDIMPSHTWQDACAAVAEDIGLDEWGFTKKQVAILAALGQRPIAETRLPGVAQCRIEQVQKYELPFLMAYTGGGPYVVSVSGRGCCITEAGLAELDKRGIEHRGRKVTAEYFESKR